MNNESTFPSDVIQTSDFTANSAFHRLKTQSTWDEAEALKRIIAATHAREIMFGMRSMPELQPRMTLVIRAGSDAYVADAGAINIDHEEREREVRDVLRNAQLQGCSLAVSSRLLPHTDELRPREATDLLGKQDVVSVGDADEAIVALKRLLGR